MDCKLSVESYGVSVLAACHRVFRLQKQNVFRLCVCFSPTLYFERFEKLGIFQTFNLQHFFFQMV